MIDRNSSFADIEEAIRLLEQYPANEPVTLEGLQAIRQAERDRACAELDKMAEQFKREDEERRRLWGNKFPRVLGAKPPENGKPINRVKGGNGKTRGTRRVRTK